jgi:dipeptidyl aminopeptidase/acylaminoacyl peptidase
MGGSPWQYPDRYRDNSPIRWFDKIETPLLISQGDIDPVTPLTGANSVFVALRRLGKPVEYRVYEDAGHGSQNRPANVADFWNRKLEFLAQHLDLVLDDQGVIVMDRGRARSRGTTTSPHAP